MATISRNSRSKKNLEQFLTSLKKPDDSLKEALKSYDDIVSGVKKKIFALITSASLLKKSVAEIEKKVETPDCKKNILLVTHQILQSNVHARKMLKLASDNLNRAVDALQNKLFAQTASDKNFFKTREVYDIIRRQFFALRTCVHKEKVIYFNGYEKKIFNRFN